MLDSHSFASISDRTIYLLFSKHRFDILFHLLCHVFILTFGYQFLTDLFPTVDLQRSSFFFCSGNYREWEFFRRKVVHFFFTDCKQLIRIIG